MASNTFHIHVGLHVLLLVFLFDCGVLAWHRTRL